MLSAQSLLLDSEAHGRPTIIVLTHLDQQNVVHGRTPAQASVTVALVSRNGLSRPSSSDRNVAVSKDHGVPLVPWADPGRAGACEDSDLGGHGAQCTVGDTGSRASRDRNVDYSRCIDEPVSQGYVGESTQQR